MNDTPKFREKLIAEVEGLLPHPALVDVDLGADWKALPIETLYGIPRYLKITIDCFKPEQEKIDPVMKGEIEKATALQYILAGHSFFTIKNVQSGNRFTFQITDVKRIDSESTADLWFVKVLTGADNNSDYQYLGCLRRSENIKKLNRPNEQGLFFEHGKKSKITKDAQSVSVIAWLIRHLQMNDLPEQIKIYHEGRCGRCGKKLTVPESVISGYGPECITKINL